MLWKPSPIDLVHLVARCKATTPDLLPPTEKAAKLLEDPDLHFRFAAGIWIVQTDPKRPHPLRDGFCDCESFASGQYKLGTRVYCKHTLALKMYRRLACQEMTRRIIPGDRPGWKQSRSCPKTYLTIESDGTLASFEETSHHVPTTILKITGTQPDLRPLEVTDLYNLVTWLASAKPIPLPQRINVALGIYNHARSIGHSPAEAADIADSYIDTSWGNYVDLYPAIPA